MKSSFAKPDKCHAPGCFGAREKDVAVTRGTATNSALHSHLLGKITKHQNKAITKRLTWWGVCANPGMHSPVHVTTSW